MESGGRVAIGSALAIAALVAAAMTLSPVPLYARSIGPIDRVLGVLHTWGVPARLDLHILELGANIVMFMPLGLLTALLVPQRRWWLVLVGALVASLAVETVQSAALPQRVGSGRDVVGNTVGAAVGIGLACAWQAWARRARRGRSLARPRRDPS